MFRTAFLVFLCILIALPVFAQGAFPSYYSQSDFAMTSPGAMKFGLYGFDNPALLTSLHQFDFLVAQSDAKISRNGFQRNGIFLAAPGLGFGYMHTANGAGSVSDYRIAFGSGNRKVSVGVSYGWSTGAKNLFGRTGGMTIGTLFRPNEYLSFGAAATRSTSRDEQEGVIEFSARPMGTELITAFADYGWANHRIAGEAKWSGGIAVEAFPGVRVTGRYFDTKAFALGVQFSVGNAGAGVQSGYDKNQAHASNMYFLRLGAYDRNIFDTYLAKKEKYLELNLIGSVGYQRFQFFDNSKTLMNLLSSIEAAKNDPTIAGIAVNTSGLMTDREKLWEVREKLKEFRQSGKKVVMFIDRGGIDLYHFASVADKIIMDPTGTITLEGYVMGRTFLRGTLEKLGLGYDEWRFFKYKSANEPLTRDKMSDADREQRQKLVDEYYRLAKVEICDGRKISGDQFDKIVNEELVFLSTQAMEQGLVDTVGRWDKVEEVIKQWSGENAGFVGRGSLLAYKQPNDNKWGEKPKIAIIYAIGGCDMDEGIAARSLVKDVKAAVDDAGIRAIVLRVDSPGGDAMASDYIAEALKKAKGKKPVIVSQGYVAASGGYWLSMYSDTIVAAPTTITGSIGVIGGFLYNKGLKESMGMSTDYVKAGQHADFGFGFTLPFIGLGVPDRNVTAEERARIELMIRSMYSEFTAKVASGRKLSQADVDSIAQGRVWTGTEGKQKGLVDVLGGLETAIAIAKEKAGIAQDQEVNFVELPKKGFFNMAAFIPQFFGVEQQLQDNELIRQVKFRLKHNGQPLPMLPLDDYDMTIIH